MQRFFHLSTCSTCQRIIKETGADKKVSMQDIKTEAITPEQLDAMADLAGSFEALFSQRAMKYKAWGLKDKDLGEQDIRELILKEYTFLKRPVLVLDQQIFVGNSAKVVAATKAALS